MQKWFNNAWLVILTLWEPFHRLIVAFRWPIAVAVIALGTVVIGVFVWQGAFTRTKTIAEQRIETIQKLSEDEREYLATAIVRDAMLTGEPERVQEGVGWAVLNYRKKYGVDIPTIVRKSLTMVPLNYKRKGILIDTSRTYVKKVEASSGQWTAALALADKLVTKGSAALSDPALVCTTQYIRKKRKTHSEPEDVVAMFENAAEYAEVPKGNSANPGEGRFFCPLK